MKAADHDFKPDSKLTPFGIYLPDLGETFLYMTSSRVTSDFIVDCLASFWETVRSRFPEVTTLLIDSDNESVAEFKLWSSRLASSMRANDVSGHISTR